MSRFPARGRKRCSTSSPVPIYRKTLDRRFDFGADVPDVMLRLRIFTPLWKKQHPPMVLLCWTMSEVSSSLPPEEGNLQPTCVNQIVNGLREEIVSLFYRVSLVERFIDYQPGKEPIERMHKVLSLPTRNRRIIGNCDSADDGNAVPHGTALLPLRRSVLEALIGEPLEEQEGEYEA